MCVQCESLRVPVDELVYNGVFCRGEVKQNSFVCLELLLMRVMKLFLGLSVMLDHVKTF